MDTAFRVLFDDSFSSPCSRKHGIFVQRRRSPASHAVPCPCPRSGCASSSPCTPCGSPADPAPWWWRPFLRGQPFLALYFVHTLTPSLLGAWRMCHPPGGGPGRQAGAGQRGLEGRVPPGRLSSLRSGSITEWSGAFPIGLGVSYCLHLLVCLQQKLYFE